MSQAERHDQDFWQEKIDSLAKDYESQSRAILETIADAVLTIDAHGIMQRCNPAAAKMFGYENNELIGKDVACLMPEKYVEAHNNALAAYRESGQGRIFGQAVELEGKRKDGTIFPIELTLGEFKRGVERMLSGVIRNISARKAQEAELARQAAELKRSNQDLDNFAYVVSHDLKAPLRAIQNYATFLGEDLEDSLEDEQREYLGGMLKATRESEDLIEDLLIFSRVGRKEVDAVHIEVESFLADLASSLSLSDSVHFHGEQWPTLHLPPSIVRQVFQNFITNGLKFNKSEDPRVDITYGMNEDGQHIFAIQDNGIGIDPRYHAKIFNIFERLNPRENFEGTGIGLAIVKRAADFIGADLSVSSKEGEGTCFTLTISQTSGA